MTDHIDCACTECQQRRCIEALRKSVAGWQVRWARDWLTHNPQTIMVTGSMRPCRCKDCREAQRILGETSNANPS